VVQIIKATGEKEPFDEQKLRASIKRAGIPIELQNDVVVSIKTSLYEDIPTSEIYRHILDFLGKSHHPFTKAKYGLKQAIMDLGPTGYPFEDFVSEILKTQGYQTTVRAQLAGACIHHEIDLILEKDGVRGIVEAKFHNSVGTKTKIHVALYTKARFDDLKEKNNLSYAWIITNTKVTADVIDYAHCVGLKVMSWSSPEEKSLRDVIETSGLSPITMLSHLSFSQKQLLLTNHIVLCKDIIENPSLLELLHLDPTKNENVLKEAQFLIQSRSNHLT